MNLNCLEDVLLEEFNKKLDMTDITRIFTIIDDFTKEFIPQLNKTLLANGKKQRVKPSKLSESEIMTIMLLFHQSGYRNFKTFYNSYLCPYKKKEFPSLVSYNRFVELKKSVIIPMLAFLTYYGKGEKSGTYFIDSTTLKVCHNRRILRHKVFNDVAQRGKTSMGWFYGFKLHLVVNDKGEIVSFVLSPGNTDDRDAKVIESLTRDLTGKIFGDRGYIKQELFETLFDNGLKLVTRLRKNMKNRLMEQEDNILLRKRTIIETINDQLKNISQIEHSRHRSISNFLVNLLSGLAAYYFQEKKPKLNLGQELSAILV